MALEIIIMLFLYGTGGSIKSLVAFIFTQSTVFQFWTPDSLRGYGCGTPNGSLWTICVIIQFYLIVWFIYKLFHKKKLPSWIILFCSSIALSMLFQKIFESYMPEIIVKLYGQTIIRYGWLFIAGCFIAEFKDMFLPYITKYWWVGLVIYLCRKMVGIDVDVGYGLVYSVSLIYMCIGFAYRFPNIKIKTDVSYEVYLFHMIIINAMLQMSFTGDWIYVGIALILTLVISWAVNGLFYRGNLFADRRTTI